MNLLENFVEGANAIIWSDVLIFFLMAVGTYFSIRMRFFQVRMFGEMVRLLLGGKKSAIGITTRIGVDYAGPDAFLPYRFIVSGNPYVSGSKNRK